MKRHDIDYNMERKTLKGDCHLGLILLTWINFNPGMDE